MENQKNNKYAKFYRSLLHVLTAVWLGGLIVNPFICGAIRMQPIENSSTNTLFENELLLLVLTFFWFITGITIALMNAYICRCNKA